MNLWLKEISINKKLMRMRMKMYEKYAIFYNILLKNT